MRVMQQIGQRDDDRQRHGRQRSAGAAPQAGAEQQVRQQEDRERLQRHPQGVPQRQAPAAHRLGLQLTPGQQQRCQAEAIEAPVEGAVVEHKRIEKEQACAHGAGAIAQTCAPQHAGQGHRHAHIAHHHRQLAQDHVGQARVHGRHIAHDHVGQAQALGRLHRHGGGPPPDACARRLEHETKILSGHGELDRQRWVAVGVLPAQRRRRGETPHAKITPVGQGHQDSAHQQAEAEHQRRVGVRTQPVFHTSRRQCTRPAHRDESAHCRALTSARSLRGRRDHSVSTT